MGSPLTLKYFNNVNQLHVESKSEITQWSSRYTDTFTDGSVNITSYQTWTYLIEIVLIVLLYGTFWDFNFWTTYKHPIPGKRYLRGIIHRTDLEVFTIVDVLSNFWVTHRPWIYLCDWLVLSFIKQLRNCKSTRAFQYIWLCPCFYEILTFRLLNTVNTSEEVQGCKVPLKRNTYGLW